MRLISPQSSDLAKNETIRLRKLKKSDLNHFLKWWKDKEIIGLTSGCFDEESDAALTNYFLNFFKNKNDHHYIFLSAEKVIGHIALNHKSAGTCEIQIVIGEKKFWGKGYGRAAINKALSVAFTKLGYVKIILEVRPENIRAIKAYESCGFVKIGFKKYPNNKNQPITLKMSLDIARIQKK